MLQRCSVEFLTQASIPIFSACSLNQTPLKSFPLTNLDLSSYVVGYDNKSYIYDLYGICNHSGGVSGGHYTAFIKNANDNWYHCNDTNIQKIGNTDVLKSPKAYCFFYRKQKK